MCGEWPQSWTKALNSYSADARERPLGVDRAATHISLNYHIYCDSHNKSMDQHGEPLSIYTGRLGVSRQSEQSQCF